MSGLQTIMALNKDLNIKKMKKIYFIKAILKLECLVYKNIYILFHFIYLQSHFDSNKSKKRSSKKNNLPNND